ncbi:MAG: hypothetical protein ONA90_00500, partial [candidate division KSB1 bacterium]|nr:hypothetical protein [candidate division KSB1 bacterium]
KPGEWNIDKNLIIPSGYRVICGEGTKLNLAKAAMILSYSALDFRGSEDFSIVIQSKDSSGQGLAVINAGEPSVMEYVTFDNLSNPSQKGWSLTGALTFYESPVHISHCQFIGNRCEDAVNVFRSDYTIDRSLFRQTQFENIFIDGAGDKGISAGESSTLTARNIDIKQAEIAVASKDGSTVFIDRIKLADSGVGFTAYRKKPEFGTASITVKNLKMGQSQKLYLIEENSSMTVDGKIIPATHTKVESVLYGVEFGKASKPQQ